MACRTDVCIEGRKREFPPICDKRSLKLKEELI